MIGSFICIKTLEIHIAFLHLQRDQMPQVATESWMQNKGAKFDIIYQIYQIYPLHQFWNRTGKKVTIEAKEYLKMQPRNATTNATPNATRNASLKNKLNAILKIDLTPVPYTTHLKYQNPVEAPQPQPFRDPTVPSNWATYHHITHNTQACSSNRLDCLQQRIISN